MKIEFGVKRRTEESDSDSMKLKNKNEEEVVQIIRGIVQSETTKYETLWTRYFYSQGKLFSSYPWIVLISTIVLSVGVLGIKLLSMVYHSYHSDEIPDLDLEQQDGSDTVILTAARVLALLYLYIQFRRILNLGSNYLLGLTGVFVVISSLLFSIAAFTVMDANLIQLNDALPFFLLLMDLSKAHTMAKFAFSATNEDEIVQNIANGVAKLGPQLTLDFLVEFLVIGMGTMSGITALERMCSFGCLSIMTNYITFTIIYPACLALILQLIRSQRPLLHLQLLIKVWQEEDNSEKSNPVTERVKVILSAGLMFIHLHSRLFLTTGSEDSAANVATTFRVTTPHLELTSHIVLPHVSVWLFYLARLVALSVDYFVTLVLASLLSIKCVFFNNEKPSTAEISKIPSIVVTSHEDPETIDEENTDDTVGKCIVITCKSDSQEACDKPDILKNESTNQAPEKLERSEYCLRQVKHEGNLLAIQDYFKLNNVSLQDTCQERRNQIEELSNSGAEQNVTNTSEKREQPHRELSECVAIYKSGNWKVELSDEEIALLVEAKYIPSYKLETILNDYERGVNIRRKLITLSLKMENFLDKLPFRNYHYKYVDGACCENVIGYMPVPLGVAGPLLLDGKEYIIPMATTEGCLVASTNRGCRALSSSGGVTTTLYKDGMTRAPVVRFPSAARAAKAHLWLESSENFNVVADAFNNTSRFARLKKLQMVQISRNLYIRFVAFTGDAMGMNMVSKGSEKALTMLQQDHFPDMEILSLSGNVCTDKKPNALNWTSGRGKSVVSEAVVPAQVVRDVLKTSTAALISLNINKNLIGSAAAGSIGGFNAQAANIVTAIYIATGQDPAQNVCSSHCITIMEATGPNDEDLYISCTMPSIEVGTVGGGTVLPPQQSCLEMLGVQGPHETEPGTNAGTLARIVCGAVMAGELSLMSALAAGHLVSSHLKHNRSALNLAQLNQQQS